MAKRFSRYKFALKANGSATGGALKKYNDFITGNSEYNRAVSSGSGAFADREIIPFALDMGSNFLLVNITERALTRLAAIGLSESLLSLKEKSANAIDVKLIPAKINGAKASTPTNKISQITGVAYKKATADAFSAPFGAKTATQKYGDQVKILKTAVEESNSKHSVSFTPERIIS